MKYHYIVAPTFVIGRDYAFSKGLAPRYCVIVVDKHDICKMRGIDNISVTVLNRLSCDRELMAFLVIRSNNRNVKLEYVNV